MTLLCSGKLISKTFHLKLVEWLSLFLYFSGYSYENAKSQMTLICIGKLILKTFHLKLVEWFSLFFSGYSYENAIIKTYSISVVIYKNW